MIYLNNLTDTQNLGKLIGRVATAGDNLVLTGDLGAGKTSLTKGIASGLEITQLIKSPTYTLIREYPAGRLPLYHMDVYRVEKGAGDLGLDEYFEGDGFCVIEWGRQLGDALPLDYLELFLKKVPQDENKRQVDFLSHGSKGKQLQKKIELGWNKDV
ncbi:MAG TPA: tRNA (adenosine(37)-N6)-threonylcarbamoyltransferase complex ATPase subunit type 1 TsaE [Tetragenococcus sp.]|nr:tRNA (adenosine(37)-N6)-threonylcarbamoyltransferase complex ATPase subunit type 1 TsaE [Tetragenococcus sp.]